ncbi:unnamed protein product [Cladocopium goreaui]|uniref:Uncharacterized protein n=1 Tax=Cladocopium goreaui TaxID=2562237 RepID=A0A9P1FTB5_9DINO|nr:unnamed protein product [Cladocopium goreaui]
MVQKTSVRKPVCSNSKTPPAKTQALEEDYSVLEELLAQGANKPIADGTTDGAGDAAKAEDPKGVALDEAKNPKRKKAKAGKPTDVELFGSDEEPPVDAEVDEAKNPKRKKAKAGEPTDVEFFGSDEEPPVDAEVDEAKKAPKRKKEPPADAEVDEAKKAPKRKKAKAHAEAMGAEVATTKAKEFGPGVEFVPFGKLTFGMNEEAARFVATTSSKLRMAKRYALICRVHGGELHPSLGMFRMKVKKAVKCTIRGDDGKFSEVTALEKADPQIQMSLEACCWTPPPAAKPIMECFLGYEKAGNGPIGMAWALVKQEDGTWKVDGACLFLKKSFKIPASEKSAVLQPAEVADEIDDEANDAEDAD